MRVRFLVDYQGHLTAEQYFLAGSEADFDAATAAHLIADGRAVAVVTKDEGRRTKDASADDGDPSSVPAIPRVKRGR